MEPFEAQWDEVDVDDITGLQERLTRFSELLKGPTPPDSPLTKVKEDEFQSIRGMRKEVEALTKRLDSILIDSGSPISSPSRSASNSPFTPIPKSRSSEFEKSPFEGVGDPFNISESGSTLHFDDEFTPEEQESIIKLQARTRGILSRKKQLLGETSSPQGSPFKGRGKATDKPRTRDESKNQSALTGTVASVDNLASAGSRSRENEAAIALQAKARGFLARRNVQKQKEAAEVLQQRSRAFLVQKAKKKQAQEEAAALRMQSLFRGSKIRKIVGSPTRMKGSSYTFEYKPRRLAESDVLPAPYDQSRYLDRMFTSVDAAATFLSAVRAEVRHIFSEGQGRHSKH